MRKPIIDSFLFHEEERIKFEKLFPSNSKSEGDVKGSRRKIKIKDKNGEQDRERDINTFLSEFPRGGFTHDA